MTIVANLHLRKDSLHQLSSKLPPQLSAPPAGLNLSGLRNGTTKDDGPGRGEVTGGAKVVATTCAPCQHEGQNYRVKILRPRYHACGLPSIDKNRVR